MVKNLAAQFTTETALQKTVVIDTELKCEDAIKQIITDCSDDRTVGLDCEWNHVGPRFLAPKIGKVLIVSICSPKGYCALFRMNKFSKTPSCLKDFLEDGTIGKVGVGILAVASNLWDDYQINLKKFVDLRQIATNFKEDLEKKLGPRLQASAKKMFDIYVARDLSDFDHKNWLLAELSPGSISFAAKDVHTFIEIHKQFFPKE